jgi:lipoate-protein ligase A
MKSFRLILNTPAHGDWNMAVDEAILESVSSGSVLPTLRLYGWKPACLSLGFSQSIQDVDQERLAEFGWGLVRRMTGGRAILHTNELTYSVIASSHEALVAGTLLESYNRIAQGLLKALRNLDLPVEINEFKPGLNSSAAGPVCFEVPSAYEITIHGKKLIGSAQARRKQGVLQHGSLPLYGDLGRITQVLNFMDESERQNAQKRLLERATTVENVLSRNVTLEEAAQAFVRAFTDELHLDFVQGDLSKSEQDRAFELVDTKYSKWDWTGRV